MKLLRALTELKKECMRRLGFKYCRCCYNSKPKQMTIHHLAYYPDSVVYDQYGNSDDERLKYYSYLLDEIKIREKNFWVMCNGCHQFLEKLLRMSFSDADHYFKYNRIMQGMYKAYTTTIKARYPTTTEKKWTGLDEFFWS